jgi:hypothetical protein
MVRKNGWDGEVLIWQYASDGDLDDNGTADGKTWGMQYAFLDLNGWVASEERYSELFEGADVIIVDPVIDGDYEEYFVTATAGLTIREQASINSEYLGAYAHNTPVNISNISNGWAKIHGQAGYLYAGWLSK